MRYIFPALRNFLETPNIAAVIIILAVSLYGLFFLNMPSPSPDLYGLFEENVFNARVVKIVSEKESERMGSGILQELLIEVALPGIKKEAALTNDYVRLEEGDELYVQEYPFGRGEYESFTLVSVDRTNELLALMVLFAAIVAVVGGMHGVRALVGLAFSVFVVLRVIIPFILNGYSPVLVGVFGALAILLVAIYVSHGFNKKSWAACIGIFATLLFVGLLASASVVELRLSGISEESFYLNSMTGNSLNIVGLLVAGTLIAVIGILDDAAVTQSSTVFALASAHHELRGARLFKKAMSVGKDHISSLINTLILAYAGAALPALLLFTHSSHPPAFVLSTEALSEEIMRALVSSIGLVLAIPLTTLVAVALIELGEKREA